MSEHRADIGVYGGSGFYEFLKDVEEIKVTRAGKKSVVAIRLDSDARPTLDEIEALPFVDSDLVAVQEAALHISVLLVTHDLAGVALPRLEGAFQRSVGHAHADEPPNED